MEKKQRLFPRKANSNAIDYQAMSEEQKADWKAKIAAGRDRYVKKRREDKERQLNVVPELVNLSAYVDQFDAEFKPREEILEIIRTALRNGVYLEDIREQCVAKGLKPQNWEKLTKFLFRNVVPHAEDLGLLHLENLQKSSKILNKKICEIENLQKRYPKIMYDTLLKYIKQLSDNEERVTTLLISLGLIGNQKSSPQITIVNNVPRPEKEIPTFEQFSNDSYTKLKSENVEVSIIHGDQAQLESNSVAEIIPSNQ